MGRKWYLIKLVVLLIYMNEYVGIEGNTDDLFTENN